MGAKNLHRSLLIAVQFLNVNRANYKPQRLFANGHGPFVV